jgi:hypothetical protein
MIVRTWRGRTSISNQSAYAEHFTRNVIPELQVVLTKWISMDAIRVFAGSDIEKAVVAPEAAAVLVEYDRTVRHYEVV